MTTDACGKEPKYISSNSGTTSKLLVDQGRVVRFVIRKR